MATEREFTPAQVAHMHLAGIPADRPGLGADYPKMMYRKTTVEDRVIQTDATAKCGETYLVQNRFDGLLCETRVADSADEAEALTAEGWDDTPKAAHGIADGLAKEASAKDDEIARLKAELEAAKNSERRGPGRPPKPIEEAA